MACDGGEAGLVHRLMRRLVDYINYLNYTVCREYMIERCFKEGLVHLDFVWKGEILQEMNILNTEAQICRKQNQVNRKQTYAD